jgi:hypothetical protein
MYVTVHTRRARAGALAATAALLLGTSTTALAQEGEPTEPTTGTVECGAMLIDDEDETYPVYLVEPGEVVECTASGLDPEDAAYLRIEFFEDDEFWFEDGGDAGEVVGTVIEDELDVDLDGTVDFDLVVPEDLLFADFDGLIWQGDEEDPTYVATFGGIVFGDLPVGEVVCEPDPATQGGEVTCTAEGMDEGEFDWEVYYLSVDELLEVLFGDDEPAPGDDGTGTAADGVGTYAFTIPAEGDIELYLTFVEQDEYFGFAFGEVEPAAVTPEPVDQGTEEPVEEKAPVTVKQPTRVDAGAGGAATGGASSTIALFGLLAATGVALVGGLRRGARTRG